MISSNRLPTLRQLKLIQELARYQSISQVAEVLHISQPSVSIQLKNLSDLIELPIYQKRGKSIELTDAGIALANSAQHIFQCLDNLQIQLNDLKGLKSGVLKLCVVSTAKYFLPLVLGAFCKKHPLIDVRLKIANRQEVIERLRQDMDDFYFLSHCPRSADIETVPFVDNELVVVAPRQHELALQERVSLARLSHYPFIMREPGSGTRLSIEQFCEQQGIKLNEKMTIESNEAIKYAVSSGLGLSILSRHTLDYGDLPGVIKLNVENFPIRSCWSLVHRKERQQSLLAQEFERFMKKEGLDALRASQ
jgi:DNA-binding transcriptional LysR family regulator